MKLSSFLARRTVWLIVALALFSVSLAGAELRLGLIGLDTSHVTAFTRLLNDPKEKNHIPGARVVVAFKGGSPDIESSIKRVDGFTKELQQNYGVRIVETIEQVCQEADAVLLTSVDGRPHLQQVRPVLRAKKPVFIDKPAAGSLKDAISIYRLAKAAKVPLFSSSSYRFYDSLVELKRSDVGEVKGVFSYGPAPTEPHHPDLYWYGIHPTEALFTILGPNCQTVSRTTTPSMDVVTGVWSEGRMGVLTGLRTGHTPHKVIIFGTKAVAEQKGGGDYAPMLREVIKFFQTGIAPVSPEETLAIMAFMEAADESKRQGGKPVSIKQVFDANDPGKVEE